jgi:hypothetical protein
LGYTISLAKFRHATEDRRHASLVAVAESDGSGNLAPRDHRHMAAIP